MTRESRPHAFAGTLYRGAVEAYRLLVASGWARSRMAGMVAQDRNGQPVPWLSYPAPLVLVRPLLCDYVAAYYARYDLVLIDGIGRDLCAERAVSVGAECVVLDNAESFPRADAILARAYRHRIPFRGLAPGYTVTETVAYLDEVRR